MNYELYHHGIKGQRWGIRRFQKTDGSLTSAGKKRYYDTPKLNKEKSELKSTKTVYKSSRNNYFKALNRYNNVQTQKNEQAMKDAEAQYIVDRAAYRRSKLKYDTDKEVARIKNEDIEFEKKSKHRLKLEEQYKKSGMTDAQAQAAANNRIQTEKILAASAALTVGACALYVANQHRKERIDGVIKAGETLQRIEMQDTGGKLHDTFYVAQGKHDMKRYENLLGACRKRQTGHAYMMKLEAQSEIKVASRNKAREVFGELYKNDPDFREKVKPYVKVHYGGRNRIANLDDFSDRNIRKMYDNFNTGIVEASMRKTGVDQKFYSKLKEAGYGAIHDINDMKYSGYNARKPLIVFDNSANNILVKSMEEMKGDLQGKAIVERLKVQGEITAKSYLERAGLLSAAALTTATVKTYTSNPAVQNYKNQHPNTNMTDRQIAAMLGV